MFKKITNKRIISMVLTAVMAFAIVALTTGAAASNSVAKSTPNEILIGVSLEKGRTTQLATYFLPNGTKDTYTWISSNAKIASVDSKGKVTGVSAGTAILTLKGTNSNTTAKLVVKVNPKPEQVKYMPDICPAYDSQYYEEYSTLSGGTKSVRMGGKNYSNALNFTFRQGYALYNLNGQYTQLSGVIGHKDGENYNKKVQFICDGIMKKEILLPKDAFPQDFTIDLSGVKQLKIVGADYSETEMKLYRDGTIHGYGWGTENVIIGNPILK